MNTVHRLAERLHEDMKENMDLREKGIGFAQRLDMIKKRGMVPGIGTAPYYIVVAERKGYPPVESAVTGTLYGKYVAEGNCTRARVPVGFGNIANVIGSGVLPAPRDYPGRMGTDGLRNRLSVRRTPAFNPPSRR